MDPFRVLSIHHRQDGVFQVRFMRYLRVPGSPRTYASYEPGPATLRRLQALFDLAADYVGPTRNVQVLPEFQSGGYGLSIELRVTNTRLQEV